MALDIMLQVCVLMGECLCVCERQADGAGSHAVGCSLHFAVVYSAYISR